MKLPDLSHIADDDTIAAAMFLTSHYANCIHATALDQDFPDPSHTLDSTKSGHLRDQMDTVLSVLNLPHSQAGKTAMVRFMAGLVDILADQGGDLEMILHAMARPDEERKAVVIVREGDVSLAALDLSR
jgi:hypothetical protein